MSELDNDRMTLASVHDETNARRADALASFVAALQAGTETRLRDAMYAAEEKYLTDPLFRARATLLIRATTDLGHPLDPQTAVAAIAALDFIEQETAQTNPHGERR